MPLIVPDAVAWGPCPQVADGAECAEIDVSLDPLDPRRGGLTVSLARIPAERQPARGQLWFVTGGPGDSGLQDLAGASGVRGLAPDLDLYTLDHRGTGFSGRLGCEREELDGSMLGAEIAPLEWAPCMASLVDRAEVLEHLTVTGAAADLVVASLAVREEGDEVYWWGVSYGTYLVQRALHVAPTLPDGVILDGLVPVDWTFSEFDAGLDAAARQLLGACADDEACARHFDGPPVDAAERAVADLDPRCADLGLDPRTVQLLTGALLMPGEPYTSLVPSVWRRLDRCDRADKRALMHLFGALFPEGGGRFEERPGHAPVMQRHVAYAELWDHGGPDAAAYERALDDVISTTAVSASFAAQAPDWPVIPGRDEWLGEWAPAVVPVLALHGGFDPTMPADRIGGFDGWLVGAGQQVVRVPMAQHVTVNAGDCPASLYAAFLADPEAPVDAGCVEEMPGFDWDGDPAFNEAVWGDPDRWGEGGGCGCGSGAGSGAPEAVLPWLVYLRLRRHRRPGRRRA